MKKYFSSIVPYSILAVVSAIVFCNTLDNTFVYDDSVTIVNNTLIKNWKNFHTLFSFNYFILSGELSYRPVVTLTYFIDYSLWGTNPAGFHLTNVLLQIINTLVIYVFLKQVTHAKITAFISSLLFTVHPILTETVNSISYREDLLATLFFLIAFILFLKSDDSSSHKGKFPLYYTGSLVSYLLSLFSKEMAVTFPVLLVLFHIFYSSADNTLRAIIKRAKGIYIGYFLITGFYLFTQFALFRGVYVRLNPVQGNLSVMPGVLASYIKLLFLPCGLNADYVVPSATAGITSLIIPVLLLITVLILIIRLCKNNKHACFFISWFFVTLLPVSNIIPLGNIMAERYLYIPILGFFGFIGVLIRNQTSKKNLTLACLASVLLLLGIMSIYRNGIWRNEFALWLSTSHREPRSARAHHNLGVVYSTQGFYDHAEVEYKKTLEINPRDGEAHYNLGNAYKRKGMTEDAVKEYKEAIRYNPFYADAYNNLGSIYKDKLLVDLAIAHYKKAIQCNPFNPNYYNNLGLIYHEKKLYQEAVIEYQKALKIDAQMSSSHNYLGNSYKELGNFKDAVYEYKTALLLDPNNAHIHNNLGILYTNIGQLEDGIREFNTAIQLDPKFANIHNNLGIAYAKKGLPEEAIGELNNAVTLGFDNADVHNNLAGVYLTLGLADKAIIELKLALKFNPTDSNAHCNLGNAYISKDLGEDAISEFKEALKYNGKDPEIHYFLGNAFYKTGQYDKAIEALHQSLHYQPNNPTAHKMLGVIYANNFNNRNKALFHLKETIRLDPQQPLANEIIESIQKLSK